MHSQNFGLEIFGNFFNLVYKFWCIDIGILEWITNSLTVQFTY